MNLKYRSNKIVPIILAAGRGSRMGKLTNKVPKSFVKFGPKKKLIENIIDNFKKFDFPRIYTITGYQSKKFQKLKYIKIIKNKNWKNTNIVGSLFCADKILSNHEAIVSYADIYYEKDALDILTQVKKKNCIVLLSYKHWKKYWKKRIKNPLDDLETFTLDKKKKLIDIGNKPNSYNNIHGQYMGLFKIDQLAWKKVKSLISKDKKKFMNTDITNLLKIILRKKLFNIYVKEYKNKWFEIDNINDYKILNKSFE